MAWTRRPTSSSATVGSAERSRRRAFARSSTRQSRSLAVLLVRSDEFGAAPGLWRGRSVGSVGRRADALGRLQVATLAHGTSRDSQTVRVVGAAPRPGATAALDARAVGGRRVAGPGRH